MLKSSILALRGCLVTTLFGLWTTIIAIAIAAGARASLWQGNGYTGSVSLDARHINYIDLRSDLSILSHLYEAPSSYRRPQAN